MDQRYRPRSPWRTPSPRFQGRGGGGGYQNWAPSPHYDSIRHHRNSSPYHPYSPNNGPRQPYFDRNRPPYASTPLRPRYGHHQQGQHQHHGHGLRGRQQSGTDNSNLDDWINPSMWNDPWAHLTKLKGSNVGVVETTVDNDSYYANRSEISLSSMMDETPEDLDISTRTKFASTDFSDTSGCVDNPTDDAHAMGNDSINRESKDVDDNAQETTEEDSIFKTKFASRDFGESSDVDSVQMTSTTDNDQAVVMDNMNDLSEGPVMNKHEQVGTEASS